MDPLKSTPLPQQDSLQAASQTPVDPALLKDAADVDSCMQDFLASFDFALDSTAEALQDSTLLEAAVTKQKESVILQDKGIDIEDTYAKKEISGKASKAIAETAEKAAEIELKDAFIATVDANGKDTFEAVTAATPSAIKAAEGRNALVIVRGNEWGMSPQYAASRGYKDGQVISWNGKQITIRYLSPSEMKSLSTVVTTFIFQIVQKESRKEKEHVSEEKRLHPSEKPSIQMNHDVKALGKGTKRKRDESSSETSTTTVRATSTKEDIKMIERAKDEASIDQQHAARALERLMQKQFKILAVDHQKYDMNNQGHQLDLLKQDHQVQQIPRNLLNGVKNR